MTSLDIVHLGQIKSYFLITIHNATGQKVQKTKWGDLKQTIENNSTPEA